MKVASFSSSQSKYHNCIAQFVVFYHLFSCYELFGFLDTLLQRHSKKRLYANVRPVQTSLNPRRTKLRERDVVILVSQGMTDLIDRPPPPPVQFITIVFRIIFVANDSFEFIYLFSSTTMNFITLCMTWTLELKWLFLANHRKQIEAPEQIL